MDEKRSEILAIVAELDYQKGEAKFNVIWTPGYRKLKADELAEAAAVKTGAEVLNSTLSCLVLHH